MENLQMSLKRKWFEMTKAGIKTEDYREINSYWAKRVFLFDGKERNTKWWVNEFFDIGTPEEIAENFILFCKAKKFDHNIMTLGYPKSGDSKRIIQFEHAGIEIRTGNPEWGAEQGKLYFVIKHGNIHETNPNNLTGNQ